jgi:putative hemolysin
MLLVILIVFFALLLFSAFFSSAETSLLSISRIRLSHRVKKRDVRALMLNDILKKPEDFFSTILIGNNLVNVGAASLATYLFTLFFHGSQTLMLIAETLGTTMIIVVFGEAVPKSYAFRHAEKLANFYAAPVRFFQFFFYPLVKILSFLSRLFSTRRRSGAQARRELSLEEIKHFLSSEAELFKSNPETLKMINEIIDISQKEIKAIMTPRPAVVALPEDASLDDLRRIVVEKHISKVPIYRGRPDQITGVVHTRSALAALLQNDRRDLTVRDLASPPIFVSEYSSLHYILNEFKRHKLSLAVVLDEYGSPQGIITLSDILSEILGELDIGGQDIIRPLRENVWQLRGSMPVEEANERLEIELPVRKEYTTLSGLFVYHFGRMPAEQAKVRTGNCLLVVKKMGKRKIDELILVRHENHHG